MFPRANEQQRKYGWVIDQEYLEKIKVIINKKSDYRCDKEEIEAVLLALEDLTTAST